MDSIDWSNWTLCEGTLGNFACDQERTISSSESVVCSLNFGADHNISKPSPTLLHLEDLSMGQYSHEDTCAIQTSDSFIVADEEMTPYDLMKNMEKVRNVVFKSMRICGYVLSNHICYLVLRLLLLNVACWQDFGTHTLRSIPEHVDPVSSTSEQQKAILLER